MAIFNSYVCLPEGSNMDNLRYPAKKNKSFFCWLVEIPIDTKRLYRIKLPI